MNSSGVALASLDVRSRRCCWKFFGGSRRVAALGGHVILCQNDLRNMFQLITLVIIIMFRAHVRTDELSAVTAMPTWRGHGIAC